MSEDKGIKNSIEYRNPIDNFLYIIIKKITPMFYKFGITPNMITTLSLITSLLGIWLFYKQKLLLLAVFLLYIGYMFDCMDGYVARKYKMTSKFGDYYDHISDIFKYIAFLLVMYKLKNNNKHFFKYFSVIAILSFLLIIDMGCEERIYDKNESDTLKHTQMLCYDINMIKWVKYFSPGTLHLVLGIIMLIYK